MQYAEQTAMNPIKSINPLSKLYSGNGPKISIFFLAIFFYFLTAIYSNGYLHADEHYQVIEFAGVINGSNAPGDLPWEFHSRIRPAIQPVLCYLVFELCDFCKIDNPFEKAMLLRIMTAMLAIAAITVFIRSFEKFIQEKFRIWFYLLSYFLWFLPFLNVRFSSEAMSGLWMLCAIALSVKETAKNSNSFLIGIFAALSFAFRYHMVFAIGGLILWLVLIRRDSLKKLLILSSGSVLILAGSIVLDSWFYGSFTLAPLNYFKAAFAETPVYQFTTEPWYFYLLHIFRDTLIPLGLLIFASLLYLVYKKPKLILLWVILPFFIAHTLIPHKELRFLFPMINLIPALILLAVQDFPEKLSKTVFASTVLKVVVAIFLMINIIALLTASLKPAGAGRAEIMESIYNMGTERPVTVLFTKNSNPYSPWGIRTNFYNQDNLRFVALDFSQNIDSLIDSNQQNMVLIVNAENDCKPEIQDFIKHRNLQEKSRSIPRIMSRLLSIYHYDNYESLVLYGKP
jgi:phosphatidylinositol glycan class B